MCLALHKIPLTSSTTGQTLPTRPNRSADSKLNALLFFNTSGNRSYIPLGIGASVHRNQMRVTKNCLQTRQYFSASNTALYRVGAHDSWKEQINFYKLCNIPFTNFHCDFMLGNQILFLNIVLHKHKPRIENSFSKYSSYKSIY